VHSCDGDHSTSDEGAAQSAVAMEASFADDLEVDYSETALAR
jgi:hypothetical protein